MGCVKFLRQLGLWPQRPQATQLEQSQASAEEAVRENEKAFSEITDVLQNKVPEAGKKLQSALKKYNATPFAELEDLMRHQGRRQR